MPSTATASATSGDGVRRAGSSALRVLDLLAVGLAVLRRLRLLRPRPRDASGRDSRLPRGTRSRSAPPPPARTPPTRPGRPRRAPAPTRRPRRWRAATGLDGFLRRRALLLRDVVLITMNPLVVTHVASLVACTDGIPRCGHAKPPEPNVVDRRSASRANSTDAGLTPGWGARRGESGECLERLVTACSHVTRMTCSPCDSRNAWRSASSSRASLWSCHWRRRPRR